MSKIENRMQELLVEAHLIRDPSGMELEPDSKDIYARAAQVLAVGLHQDLPDDLNAATDYMVEIMLTLARRKKPLILRALRLMGRKQKAMGVLQQIKKEY